MSETRVLQFQADALADAQKALENNDDIGYWTAQGRLAAYRHIAWLLHVEEK